VDKENAMQTSTGPVPIRISNTGQVVDARVRVFKSRGGEVEWRAQDGGGPWTITFGKMGGGASTHPVEPGSPYGRNSFTVPPGESIKSGPIRENANVNKTYRYTVTDRSGTPTHDPDVDVET
jgi:hypothetical protein